MARRINRRVLEIAAVFDAIADEARELESFCECGGLEPVQLRPSAYTRLGAALLDDHRRDEWPRAV
jgi:hypothetical protein